MDIDDLLQHAEVTEELHASVITYTPAQHHSAYKNGYFAPYFLTAIRNVVGLFILTYPYIRVLNIAVSLHYA